MLIVSTKVDPFAVCVHGRDGDVDFDVCVGFQQRCFEAWDEVPSDDAHQRCVVAPSWWVSCSWATDSRVVSIRSPGRRRRVRSQRGQWCLLP